MRINAEERGSSDFRSKGFIRVFRMNPRRMLFGKKSKASFDTDRRG
jgi:hypothetical protein